MVLQTQTSPTSQTLCPVSHCRAEVFADDVFCQECGERLPEHYADAAVESRFLARLHPESTKSAFTAPLVIMGLAFALVAIPAGWMLYESSKPDFSMSYTYREALKAYQQKHFDEAAGILQRMALIKPLTEEQNQLLAQINDAKATQAAKPVASSNAPPSKISTLRRVPGGQRLSSLAKDLGSTPKLPYLSRTGGASAQYLPAALVRERDTPVMSSSNEPSESLPKDSNKPEPAYTEHDVVRYNELLAGYFSQERKVAGKANEPPSLKEWITLGKPKF